MRLRKPSFFVSLVFFLSAFAGFASAALGGGGRNELVPAQPGEPSYAISNMSVSYPFVETTVDGRQEDPARVGVTFETHWTSSTFPGEAECDITVMDLQGDIIGAARVNVGSLTPDAGPSDTPIPIAVTGMPVTATGVCAAAARPLADADSWGISSTAIERPREGVVMLVGAIQWKGGHYPGWGACKATLSMADGATRSLEFNLDMPEGRSVLALLPPELTDVLSVSGVTCSPFAGA